MMTRTARDGSSAAFTLVEILLVAAIFVMLFSFLVATTDQTARIWSSTSAKVEQFREARTGFERVTSRLSQAVLNTYWAYNNDTAPTHYLRQSELRFITGSAPSLLGNTKDAIRSSHTMFFNAPLGLAGSANDRALHAPTRCARSGTAPTPIWSPPSRA